MNDDFLEAAILNWDDLAEPAEDPLLNAEAPTEPQRHTMSAVSLLAGLGLLVVLIVGYRWLTWRGRP